MDNFFWNAFEPLFYLACVTGGFVVGSAFSAICLRLAASYMKLPRIPFRNAFCTCAMTALASFLFAAMPSFNAGVMRGMSMSSMAPNGISQNGMNRLHREQEMMAGLIAGFTPFYFLIAFVLSGVLTAHLMTRLIRMTDEHGEVRRLTLGDAIALLAVHYVIVALVIAVIACVALTGSRLLA